MSDEEAPASNGFGGHDPEAALDLAELEALRAEVAGLKEQVLRYAAEADNTKRRAEREMNDARAYAITKFARDLMGVADILERATASAPRDNTEQAVKNFVVGIEMTAKELQGAFERNNLKRVEPDKGGKFDPHLHQAMMEQPGDGVPPGAIIKTLQAGYELFGRIVRPAMVVVAAKTGAPAEPQPDTPAHNPYSEAADDESGGSVDTKA
ncbi:molecular chaperone GrpE [Caulobacter ginsengisoli]|uniref:Protein GrpE n=1 Tax=Caulobacter ginsengisoli TaxID=400775 RepID=A0ABU0IUL2_9CAUL|nr:nucleotide exchange factor GrpE [Caulobacter ginsengisoli]MDQ0465699.1 molecular chaperone GrpE [Caulobacter ginsengisoli]